MSGWWPEEDPRWDDDRATVPYGPRRPGPALVRPTPPARWWRRPRQLVVMVAGVGALVGVGVGRSALVGDHDETCGPPSDEPVQYVALDPDRCDTGVRYDRDSAVLTGPTGARFRLGAPGDWLLVGDWDCDGSRTPGLYRPSTGAILLFDAWAVDGEIRSDAPIDTGIIDGRPRVRAGDRGCHEITVDTTAGDASVPA